jgi:lysozyme family protein
MFCCLVKQWLMTGNQDWRQLLLDGTNSRDKHFLAAYLCASLYHFIKDPQSRQIIFADHEAQAAFTAALLGAAQNTNTLVSSASPACLVNASVHCCTANV